MKAIIKKYTDISQKIFFATEKKPFTTIPSAFKAVDDLRNEHSENTSKMSQLDEINSYILELQKFYEAA